MLLAASTAGCLGGSEISGSDARERALAAEEQHIPDQLENASCVTGWSPTSFVGLEEQATVENRTNDGVYVVVKHPYSYSTDEVNADVGSEARYLVKRGCFDHVVFKTDESVKCAYGACTAERA